MIRDRRGVALLEALVAIAVVSMVSVSTVGLVSAALADQWQMRNRESALADAHRVLAAATLLTRGDLDVRLGRRRVGEFFIDVRRPEGDLYRVAVTRVDTPSVEELATVLYRPGGYVP